MMKRNDVKSKNYETNEKRLKEEKIWDEFNDSEMKHSVYDGIDDVDTDFNDLKLSRNFNRLPTKIIYDEDQYKRIQDSKSIHK